MEKLSDELLQILVCPKCKGGLVYHETEARLDCPACQLHYPVREGIPVMLVEEATPFKGGSF